MTISPVFIVGMPRSGTKLLRNILNNNKFFNAPDNETHFIPKFLLKYSEKTNWDEMFDSFQRTHFFKVAPKKKPEVLCLKKLSENLGVVGFVEAILKYYSNNEGKWCNDLIWGDKTPLYLFHMPILKEHFPSAKFIHIIRDPRDRAVSVKNTWKNSYLRAAEMWRSGVEGAWKFQKLHPRDYFEVLYEDLLANPDECVKRVCEFLEINFDCNMTKLKKPTEKYGLTSQQSKIVVNNTKKYRKLRSEVINKIEEITFPALSKFPYKIHYATKFKPLNSMVLLCLWLFDILSFRVMRKIRKY